MIWSSTTTSDIGIKQKIRKLKKAEMVIRFPDGVHKRPLVWDNYFNKADLGKLAAMSPEDYKSVVDEFFSRVYYEFYMENGISFAGVYDPSMLAKLGLPPHADESSIKARFRRMAKECHPDNGGSAEEFVELMKIYKELLSFNC